MSIEFYTPSLPCRRTRSEGMISLPSCAHDHSRDLLTRTQIDRRLAQHVRVYESDRGGHGAAIRQRNASVHRATVYRDVDLERADHGLGQQCIRTYWSVGQLESRPIAHDTLLHRQKPRFRTGRLRVVVLDRCRLAHQHEVNPLIYLLTNAALLLRRLRTLAIDANERLNRKDLI